MVARSETSAPKVLVTGPLHRGAPDWGKGGILYVETDAPAHGCVATARIRQGKELSYNNLADADAALECVKAFAAPACVIVKHANPCGVAVAGFDVNIRCTRFHRVVNDGIDQFDDRRHIGIRRQAVEVQNLFALLGFLYERDLKARRRFLQHSLRRVAFLQNNVDRTLRCDIRNDADIQRILYLVQPFKIGRVRHRGVQVAAFAF